MCAKFHEHTSQCFMLIVKDKVIYAHCLRLVAIGNEMLEYVCVQSFMIPHITNNNL